MTLDAAWQLSKFRNQGVSTKNIPKHEIDMRDLLELGAQPHNGHVGGCECQCHCHMHASLTHLQTMIRHVIMLDKIALPLSGLGWRYGWAKNAIQSTVNNRSQLQPLNLTQYVGTYIYPFIFGSVTVVSTSYTNLT